MRRLLGLAAGLIISLCVLCVVYTFRLLRWANRVSRKPQPSGESRNRFRLWSRIRSRVSGLTWAERVGTILLGLAFVFYLAGQRQVTLATRLPAEALLKQHVFVHVAEYSRQTLRWAALSLLICGLCLCL